MFRHATGVTLLTLLLAVCAAAQSRAVWRIGEFDQSGDELGDAAPAAPFVVGTSRAGDWGRTQQAVTPDKAATTTPRRIRFDLREEPRGAYVLRVGLIVRTPRLAVVQLDVNGRRGWFHQRFVDYREGNWEPSIFPQYAIGALEAPIPAEFLRQGANEIAVTAVADPISTALPGGGLTDNDALIYDALELTNDSSKETAAGVHDAEVTPTVYYRREGARLSEVVSVLVRWGGLAPQGEVALSVGGVRRAQTFSSGREFGDESFEFTVPEFAPGARARVEVAANGRTYNFAQSLVPAKKWTVLLVPHEHLDVGYSDFQTKLAELHGRVVDEALAMTDARPDFRFSLDGYWQAQQFIEGRSDAERRRLFDAVRAHKIFVPAQHSVMLTGFPTAEALLHSFYPAHKFNREHGGPWDYVNITDVPSYSWSYASILAAAGLRYFSAAANADRGPTLMLGDLHRRSPFWWEGPDGSRVLVWYARHYHQIGSEFGFPPALANGYEGIPTFLQVYTRPDYTSDAVLLHGSQWENTSLYPQQANVVGKWNELFAYPRLQYAGFGEAIAEIARRAKNDLPVVRGDGGPYWEDGVASDAAYAAMERENERRAASAEKLSTVASLVDPRFAPPKNVLDKMWDDIALMSEHTWGWGRSVTEPHSEDSTRELSWKRLRAVTARDSVDYVTDRAMTAVASSIKLPARALVVFNTLNWGRGGWVEFDLQKTRELVDIESGRTVAFDVLEDHPAYQRIRFLARAVPAVGYRTYEVRDKAPAPAAPNVSQPGAKQQQTDARQPVDSENGETPSSRPRTSQPVTIENQFYRVTLDASSGAVRSIFDKQLSRELVDQSSLYRFNQYVYVTGGDEYPNQLLTYRRSAPYARLEAHPSDGGRIVSVAKTATGTVARLESRGVNTPRIATEIVLRDDSKKIEFVNRVTKETIYRKEAAYFAFPFAARDPRFAYEVQNGVVNPARDMIPGAGLEWFSSQNWMAVSDQNVSAALVCKDSFLWTFGDVVRGLWPTEFKPRDATAFAYVMNNYWMTNYVAAQGGDFTFRFVLTSAPTLDPAALSRIGWEETTPLERVLMKSQDKAAPGGEVLPAAKSSFLSTDSPDVLLSTWKRAESGDGTVLRFIELAGRRAKVTINSPLLADSSAVSCNAMEDCGRPLDAAPGGFTFETSPRQITTARVKPQRATVAPQKKTTGARK
jgi:hypothetical protein